MKGYVGPFIVLGIVAAMICLGLKIVGWGGASEISTAGRGATKAS
jgi:hypothetical protein